MDVPPAGVHGGALDPKDLVKAKRNDNTLRASAASSAGRSAGYCMQRVGETADTHRGISKINYDLAIYSELSRRSEVR